MFDGGCAALKKVTLGDDFVINDDAVLSNMFVACTSLENIYVKKGTD